MVNRPRCPSHSGPGFVPRWSSHPVIRSRAGWCCCPGAPSFTRAAPLRVEVGTGRGRPRPGRRRGSFMSLRAQRTPRASLANVVEDDSDVTESSTDVHPWYMAGDADADAATAIGLRVPGVRCFYGGTTLYLIDHGGRSWATVTVGDSPPYPVEQAGRRKLHDEVIAAYQWWREAGRPATGDWLVTIDQHGQHIALSHRAGTVDACRTLHDHQDMSAVRRGR